VYESAQRRIFGVPAGVSRIASIGTLAFNSTYRLWTCIRYASTIRAARKRVLRDLEGKESMDQPSSSPSNLQPLGQVRQPTSLPRRANGIALVLALLWLLLIGLTLTPQVDDFKWYWQAGRSFSETGDPYHYKDDPVAGIISQPQPAPEPGDIVAPIFAYGYPPLFAYAMQPLGRLDYRTAQWIWFGLNTLLLIGLIALCMQLSRSTLARRYWGITAWPGQHPDRRDAGRLPGAGTPPIPGWFAVGQRQLDQAHADCDRDALRAMATARCAVVDDHRRSGAAGDLAAGLWRRAVPAFFR
jgi:hypothetical protein